MWHTVKYLHWLHPGPRPLQRLGPEVAVFRMDAVNEKPGVGVGRFTSDTPDRFKGGTDVEQAAAVGTDGPEYIIDSLGHLPEQLLPVLQELVHHGPLLDAQSGTQQINTEQQRQQCATGQYYPGARAECLGTQESYIGHGGDGPFPVCHQRNLGDPVRGTGKPGRNAFFIKATGRLQATGIIFKKASFIGC